MSHFDRSEQWQLEGHWFKSQLATSYVDFCGIAPRSMSADDAPGRRGVPADV